MAAFEARLNLPAIHRAQAGLIADMDYVADVLYGRAAKRQAPARRDEAALAGGLTRHSRPHHLKRSIIMENTAYRAIAIVGAGAILPDAPNVPAFWNNIKNGRYSITEVDAGTMGPGAYFDADHSAPDKTYSKIGGWVREYPWDPMKWRLPIPPRVADAMDESQKWAIACTREALEDYGYPKRPLDTDRTAVILGNAMAGEKHYLTSMRVYFPEYAQELEESASFAASARRGAARHHARIARPHRQALPPITEDTMPGELANCLAGRIANVYNFHGPNYVCDAACASAMAAISAAVEGLIAERFRRSGHRRHRPQHGRADLRQVLQDRRALGNRHASVCRGRGRFRHGRRRGDLPDEAPGRCRARRRQDLRRAARHRAVQRRQGKGHYGAQPDRPEILPSSAPGRTPDCRRPPRR